MRTMISDVKPDGEERRSHAWKWRDLVERFERERREREKVEAEQSHRGKGQT